MGGNQPFGMETPVPARFQGGLADQAGLRLPAEMRFQP